MCNTKRSAREVIKRAQRPPTSLVPLSEEKLSNSSTIGDKVTDTCGVGGSCADICPRQKRKRISPQLITPSVQTKKQIVGAATAMKTCDELTIVSDSLKEGRTILVTGWSGAPKWPAYIDRCSVAQDGGEHTPTVADKSVLLTLFYEAYPEAGYFKPTLEYAIITGSKMVQWLPGEKSEDEEQPVLLSWEPADKEASFTTLELEELISKEIEDFETEKIQQAAQWVSAQPAHTQLTLASGYKQFIASTAANCVHNGSALA